MLAWGLTAGAELGTGLGRDGLRAAFSARTGAGLALGSGVGGWFGLGAVGCACLGFRLSWGWAAFWRGRSGRLRAEVVWRMQSALRDGLALGLGAFLGWAVLGTRF